MNDLIADKIVQDTIFKCKICDQQIIFNITNKQSFVSSTEGKEFFGTQLTTYRVYHDVNTERHHNAVLVDNEGAYRGHVDGYAEEIPVQSLDNLSKKDQTTMYKGIIPVDVALNREKSAFILDKSILKLVCIHGPISIEEIRRRTLDLEAPLGLKIDLTLIKEICDKYIKEGLISEVIQ